MLIIESDAYDGHYPHWAFQLGGERYKTKDVPSRVEAIKRELKKDRSFDFKKAESFAERHIASLHPYHSFIKRISENISDDKTEIYPDLFPGEGAGLPRRMRSPLWAGLYCTDAVTPIMKKTYPAARGSAECALTGARLLQRSRERAVYALCRPSGHHAGPRVFGGYCYFNNVAVAAEFLSSSGRVAVLDIDYHHGNGTQEFFERRADVLTSSIHGDPAEEYPYFWGYRNERGRNEAVGTNLNLPLKLGSDNGAYLKAVDKVCRAIRRFGPRYLIVSAGFDTHADDPIGGFKLSFDAYPEIGKKLATLKLPTLFCQEGGYNLKTLGRCVRGLLAGYME
ncbi:histone deacetylase family protein [Gemmatimonadota bacterium]